MSNTTKLLALSALAVSTLILPSQAQLGFLAAAALGAVLGGGPIGLGYGPGIGLGQVPLQAGFQGPCCGGLGGGLGPGYGGVGGFGLFNTNGDKIASISDEDVQLLHTAGVLTEDPSTIVATFHANEEEYNNDTDYIIDDETNIDDVLSNLDEDVIIECVAHYFGVDTDNKEYKITHDGEYFIDSLGNKFDEETLIMILQELQHYYNEQE